MTGEFFSLQKIKYTSTCTSIRIKFNSTLLYFSETNNAKTDKEKITHPDNSVDVDIVDRQPCEMASNNSVAQNSKVAHRNKAMTSNGIVTRSNRQAQGGKSVQEENTIENGPSVCDNFLPSNPDISSSQDEERDTTTENANSNNSQLENGSSDDEEVSQIIEVHSQCYNN